MKINFSLEEAVRKRYSVRNYSEEEISGDTRKSIEAFITSLDNPFGKEVNYHYLNIEDGGKGKRLGTYGVIKGAKEYIGTTIEEENLALEALGYELEVLILYLASIGIGTCWLGGTFNRDSFAEAMNVGGELFPVITPYGYPAERKHSKEAMMRKMISADKRKSWEELFFKENFGKSLSKEESGDLEFLLEMVRLGPSASNKQPWRIVVDEKKCHFYEDREPGYSDRFPYDIQRIDMGIAAAHFELAAKEKAIKGSFKLDAQPSIDLPEHMYYLFTWIRD